MITLKTLPNATAQEVFDQVTNHLLTQKKQSRNAFYEGSNQSYCLYRTDSGLKCAAGCLIADDEYDISLEDEQWDDLVESEKVPEDHKELIQDLQVVHDSYPPEDWASILENLAKSLGLEFNFPAPESTVITES